VTVAELIRLMKSGGAGCAKPIPIDGLPDMEFACSFEDTVVENSTISREFAEWPGDLVEFWRITSRARLFEDQRYGQWGLSILDPATAVAATQRFRERRFHDFLAGDLVLGRFIGDSDLLIVRCDPSSSDFGHVLVATPIDPRAQWSRIAKTFAGFLDNYIQACSEKYWAGS